MKDVTPKVRPGIQTVESLGGLNFEFSLTLHHHSSRHALARCSPICHSSDIALTFFSCRRSRVWFQEMQSPHPSNHRSPMESNLATFRKVRDLVRTSHFVNDLPTGNATSQEVNSARPLIFPPSPHHSSHHFSLFTPSPSCVTIVYFQTSTTLFYLSKMSSSLLERSNDALRINPNGNLYTGPSDINITTHGSDWYWAVTAVMATATLTFIGLSFTVPRRARVFHYITSAITMTAAVAYFTMASNLGYTPIHVEFSRSNHKVAGTFREIFYVRYIDWVITTPVSLHSIKCLLYKL